jgi:hypothetical protein
MCSLGGVEGFEKACSLLRTRTLLIAYHNVGDRPRGLSVPLTATGKAAPSTIYI